MYPGGVPLDGSSYVNNVMHTFCTSAEDVENGWGTGTGALEALET